MPPYAAPTGLAVSALVGIRNAILNGDCRVHQFAPANSSIARALDTGDTPIFTVIDAIYWRAQETVAVGQITLSQVADHPILGAQGSCKRVVINVPKGSPLPADDYALIGTFIEAPVGANFSTLQAVLSFWVKSSRAGTYCVSVLGNTAGNDSYVVEYTIFQANVWEQKLIGIPFNAVDPAGENVGVRFTLGAGANRQASPNAWQVSNDFYGTVNQTQLITVAAADFRITDIQLELGVVSTPFDREPFDQSLMRCRRIYQHSFPYGTIPVSNFGTGAVNELRWTQVPAAALLSRVRVPFVPPMIADVVVDTFNPSAAGVEARDITSALNCTGTGIIAPAATDQFIMQATGNALTLANSTIAVNWRAEFTIP